MKKGKGSLALKFKHWVVNEKESPKTQSFKTKDFGLKAIFGCAHQIEQLVLFAGELWWRLQVLAEVRPYLADTVGGVLELVQINDSVVEVQLSGPASGVITVRVAYAGKLEDKVSDAGCCPYH
ncbi:NifU-like protein 3 [Ancistrocladus abbreviatus]